MKKRIKRISYLLVASMLTLTLAGCTPEEKVEAEELRQYAEMLDPQTLREYAAMLEEVADELEAKELDADNVEEVVEEDSVEDNTADEDDAVEIAGDQKIDDKKDAALEEEVADKKEEISKDEEEKEPVDIKSIVEEQFSNDSEVEYKAGKETETIEVSYHIPEIKDDSKDAKAINAEIKELFEKPVELLGTNKEPEYASINYDVHQYGDIASIVVYGIGTYGETLDTKVFSYNVKTHKKAESEEVLSTLDYSDEELEKYLAQTLGAYVLSEVEGYIDVLDKYYTVDKEACAGVIGAIANTFQVALSETDFSEDMTVYLGSKGEPRVVGNISLPDGYGTYKFDTELDTSEKPEIYKKYAKYVEKYHYPEFEMQAFILDNGGMYEMEVPEEYKDDDFDYDNVRIGFSEDDESIFVCTLVKDGEEEEYTGTVSFAGISDKGFEFAFSLDKLNDEKLKSNIKKGTFSIIVEFDYDDEGYLVYQGARITSIDGFDFTGAKGQEVLFDLKKSIKNSQKKSK